MLFLIGRAIMLNDTYYDSIDFTNTQVKIDLRKTTLHWDSDSSLPSSQCGYPSQALDRSIQSPVLKTLNRG